MSNEVVKNLPNGFAGLPKVENPYAKDFQTFTSALYLPRLSLVSSSSSLAKKKKIDGGDYMFVTGRELFEDLGPKVDVLVLCYRVKALDMSDKANIISSFKPESELFKSIQSKATNKKQGEMGSMYGLEFLLYIPTVKHATKFCTFYLGNPTGRVAAKNFAPILQQAHPAATLSYELASNAEHSWEAPVITLCTKPLVGYPSPEEMDVQMKAFLNPIEGVQAEQATTDEATSTDRDR